MNSWCLLEPRREVVRVVRAHLAPWRVAREVGSPTDLVTEPSRRDEYERRRFGTQDAAAVASCLQVAVGLAEHRLLDPELPSGVASGDEWCCCPCGDETVPPAELHSLAGSKGD